MNLRKKLIATIIVASTLGVMSTNTVSFAKDIRVVNEVSLASEVTVEKYDNSLSSDLKVSREEIKSITNNAGNHSTSVIGNAIDGNDNTFWETSKPNSSSFTNEVIVELEETQTIDTLLYGARKKGAIIGKGFSKNLEIHVSSTSEGDNFELVGNAKYQGSIRDTVKIGFEPIQAKRIKLVLKDAYKDWTSISELGLYKSEASNDENDSNIVTPTKNTAPVLTGVEDIEMLEGQYLYFSAYAGVGATDKEDGRLNHLVKAKGGVDVNVPGEYKITYSVTDSQGLTTERIRTVTVVKKEEVSPENNTAPVLSGVEDKTITIGDYAGIYMDPLYGVKAIDKEDGNITRNIKTLGIVRVDIPGVYKIKYSVKDSLGLINFATRTVTVLPKEGTKPEVPADQNASPVFHGVKDISVTVGERVNPLVGITVTDREDGPITKIGVCGPLTPSQMLDTSKPGIHLVKYSVKDSQCVVSYAERYIYVLAKDEAPKFSGVENKTIKVGESFNILDGVNVNDKEDASLNHKIVVKGNVDTSKAGVYSITYKVVDSHGNEVSTIRNITVL